MLFGVGSLAERAFGLGERGLGGLELVAGGFAGGVWDLGGVGLMVHLVGAQPVDPLVVLEVLVGVLDAPASFEAVHQRRAGQRVV